MTKKKGSARELYELLETQRERLVLELESALRPPKDAEAAMRARQGLIENTQRRLELLRSDDWGDELDKPQDKKPGVLARLFGREG